MMPKSKKDRDTEFWLWVWIEGVITGIFSLWS